jgi:hypothetical protein
MVAINLMQQVASRYDAMNDFMSGGLHRLWKDHLVSTLGYFSISILHASRLRLVSFSLQRGSFLRHLVRLVPWIAWVLVGFYAADLCEERPLST